MTSDHFMKTLGTVVGIEGYLASRIAAEDAEKKWTGLTRHRDGGQAHTDKSRLSHTRSPKLARGTEFSEKIA